MTCEPVESFVFYRSFLEAIGEMDDKDKLDTFEAICNYAIYGVDPALSSPFSRAVFSLAKPSIDANRGRRANGKKGGRPQKTTNENHRFSETESTEAVTEAVTGSEAGSEAVAEACRQDDGLGRVMTAFMDKINPTPSRSSLGLLKGYCEEMGAEVCLEAIDRALDAGETKRNWNYIRGILKSLSQQGVKCLADWKRIEENRQTGRGSGKVPCGSAGQGPLGEVERAALARMLGQTPQPSKS